MHRINTISSCFASFAFLTNIRDGKYGKHGWRIENLNVALVINNYILDGEIVGILM